MFVGGLDDFVWFVGNDSFFGGSKVLLILIVDFFECGWMVVNMVYVL